MTVIMMALTAFQIGLRVNTFPSVLRVEAEDTTCGMTSGTERTLFLSVQLPLLRLARGAQFERAADAVTNFEREWADTLDGNEGRERNKAVLTSEAAQVAKTGRVSIQICVEIIRDIHSELQLA